jgi:hypothetical protein
MKILIAGLISLATGLALVLFTDLDPAMLFIGGVLCTFIGIIEGGHLTSGSGAPMSADPTGDAAALSNLANYGSTAGDVGATFSNFGQP